MVAQMAQEIAQNTTQSPYTLDESQTLRATSSLLKHIHKSANDANTKASTRNLLGDDTTTTNGAEPIWLVLTTKSHIVPQPRLKPGKIFLPHSLNTDPNLSVCLITADPQRSYKDLLSHTSFPPKLAKQITRVIGIQKLQKKYKSFESQRQLRDSHDVFLVDDRVVTYLSKILGRTFYDSAVKRPIPVRLQAPKPGKPNQDAALPSTKAKKEVSTDRSIVTPEAAAKEIQRTLSTTLVKLSPSVTTSVRVGLSSQDPAHVAENIGVVVAEMTKKYIPRQWRGIQAIHIKGPNTMALPVWLASELWADETQVLEDEEYEAQKQSRIEAKKQKKPRALGDADRSAIDSEEGGSKGKKRFSAESDSKLDRKAKKAKALEESLSQEMQERRELLRQQKQEVRASLGKQV